MKTYQELKATYRKPTTWTPLSNPPNENENQNINKGKISPDKWKMWKFENMSYVVSTSPHDPTHKSIDSM